jgi:hypothetical protein
VSESEILPWIQDEAARLGHAEAFQASRERRNELRERRRRVIDNYEATLIDKEERDAKIASLNEELLELEIASEVSEAPPDWTASAEAVNRSLRALWEFVEMGPDLRPVRAEWRIPAWRVA